MEIDIRNIPVYWITIESATDRHERMQKIFSKFGFTNTIQINGKLANKEGKSLSKMTQWRTQANKNGVSQNATIIFCNNIFLFGCSVMNTYTICVLCNIGYAFNLTILCSSGVSRQRKRGVSS